MLTFACRYYALAPKTQGDKGSTMRLSQVVGIVNEQRERHQLGLNLTMPSVALSGGDLVPSTHDAWALYFYQNVERDVCFVAHASKRVRDVTRPSEDQRAGQRLAKLAKNPTSGSFSLDEMIVRVSSHSLKTYENSFGAR